MFSKLIYEWLKLLLKETEAQLITSDAPLRKPKSIKSCHEGVKAKNVMSLNKCCRFIQTLTSQKSF